MQRAPAGADRGRHPEEGDDVKKPLIWAVVVVAAVAAFWVWRSRSAPREAVDPAAALGTATVERRTLALTVETTGQVEPVRVVEVKSRASGEVLRVHAETGDEVEAGALLAEIDPRDVQNSLDQAEADVASAREHARVASAQVERVRQLLAAGIVPAQELDSAEDSAVAARSAVLRAETNLELARERRRDVTIRAPIVGTVITRTVEPGQIIASATANVSGGTTLFAMADLASMRVRANIDETDVGRIRAGQPVRVTLEAHAGRIFRGEVEKVEPQAVVEQNVTQFPVLVRIDNSERRLLPGMTAEIALEVARREGVLAVPNGAVVGARDAVAAAQALGVPVDTVRAALRGVRPAAADSEPAGATPPRGNGDTRPGVLFVTGAAGLEPRPVRFGISDWEYTEVVDETGEISEGTAVMLVTVAQIQRQQESFEQRIRERAGSTSITGGSARPAQGR